VGAFGAKDANVAPHLVEVRVHLDVVDHFLLDAVVGRQRQPLELFILEHLLDVGLLLTNELRGIHSAHLFLYKYHCLQVVL